MSPKQKKFICYLIGLIGLVVCLFALCHFLLAPALYPNTKATLPETLYLCTLPLLAYTSALTLASGLLFYQMGKTLQRKRMPREVKANMPTFVVIIFSLFLIGIFGTGIEGKTETALELLKQGAAYSTDQTIQNPQSLTILHVQTPEGSTLKLLLPQGIIKKMVGSAPKGQSP